MAHNAVDNLKYTFVTDAKLETYSSMRSSRGVWVIEAMTFSIL